nr:MAG TPA: hypothetical protein [Caudoviricetes sp.]
MPVFVLRCGIAHHKRIKPPNSCYIKLSRFCDTLRVSCASGCYLL